MWQSDGRAADERPLFVSPLQEVRQQFPFALHKDGPPPHEAEVVLLQDVVAFFHHLGGSRRIVSARTCVETRQTQREAETLWKNPKHFRLCCDFNSPLSFFNPPFFILEYLTAFTNPDENLLFFKQSNASAIQT